MLIEKGHVDCRVKVTVVCGSFLAIIRESEIVLIGFNLEMLMLKA